MLRNQIREAREEGFTLIELLIVIVVLGVLAGIVVFGLAQFRSQSVLTACRADIKTVQTAADAFQAQTGAAPTSIAILVTGGYLKTAPASPDYAVTLTGGTLTAGGAC